MVVVVGEWLVVVGGWFVVVVGEWLLSGFLVGFLWFCSWLQGDIMMFERHFELMSSKNNRCFFQKIP